VSDKLAHFIAYFILAALLVLSIRTRSLVGALLGIMVVLAYGAFDELTQPLVGRFASLEDWLANAAGAMVATVVMIPFCRTWGPPSENSP
jgi:VanZ family protein